MAKSRIRDVFSLVEFEELGRIIAGSSTYDRIVPLPGGPWSWGQALLKNVAVSSSGLHSRGGFFMFTDVENNSWGRSTAVSSETFVSSGGIQYFFHISRPRVYFFDADARTSDGVWGSSSVSPRIRLDSAVIQNGGSELRLRFRNIIPTVQTLDVRGRIKVMKTRETT